MGNSLGKYYDQAKLGRVFIGSTTNAGVAVPVYNATAQTFGLWNPAGSGVNLVLGKLSVAVATLGTNIVSALGLSYLLNVGAAIGAAGAPITAFTATAPFNAILGQGDAPKGRFTLSATTIAPAFLMSLPMAQNVSTTAPNAEQAYSFDFDGMLIIPPNVYIGLGGSAAPGSTYQASLSWAEVAAS
jgi:hypothetical protein